MATITELEVGRIVGAPLDRKEDAALLTGQAKFVDDMSLPGMVWMAVVRSPYAHARIANVNVDGALAHRGVIAAFTGEELAEEWQASLPCAWLPTEDTNQPNHRPLAVDEARYVGDGVAVVIAESRGEARDAAELVQPRPLPAVQIGDLLLIHDAGAYGYTMSSNYNSLGRAPQVWVENGLPYLISRRETFEDIIRTECFTAL